MKNNGIRLLLGISLAIGVFSKISYAQSPVASYPFNGNANDESGNNLNAVVTNASLTSDRFNRANNAYYFNGTSSYLTVTHAGDKMDFNSEFSISLWFKADQGYNTRSALIYTRLSSTGDEQGGFGMDYAPSGFDSTVVFYKAGTTALNTGYANPTKTRTNKWHHIVVTYTPSLTGRGIMYVNGVKTDSTQLGLPEYFIGNSPMRIGAVFNLTGFTQFFKGCIDDINIYNEVISPAQVKKLYEFCPATKPSSLGASRCGEGTLSLSATGGVNYRWYDVEVGGTILGSIVPFVTPLLIRTDTFFVSSYSTVFGCESERALSLAVVNPIPAPIEITGPVNVFSSYTENYSVPIRSGSTYAWELIGGTGSSTSSSIAVLWNATLVNQTGSVKVTETNISGCSGEPVLKSIGISPFTSIEASQLVQDQTMVFPNPSAGKLTVQTPLVISKIILNDLKGNQEVHDQNSFVSEMKGLVVIEIHTIEGIIYKKVLLQ